VAGNPVPRSLAAEIHAIISNSTPPPVEIRKAVLKYSWSNIATAILAEYAAAMRHHSDEDVGLVFAQAQCG
jgi:hypothetical protein